MSENSLNQTLAVNRRQFLAGVSASPLLAAVDPAAVPVPRTWINPHLEQSPAVPWRKIHLDFHNSQYVPRIGERFNADEFGDRLLEGNVSGVVVFAKDMHGYFYYPSKFGPVHRGLDFDLLAAQVAACRKRNIAVYAYYCTTWDNYLAENHPEWLVMRRDRTSYLPKFDETPSWTALCLVHEQFVQLMLDHTQEFASAYPVDGVWFDMPMPIGGECFCSECLRQLREKGLDPFDTAVQRRHKQALQTDFLVRAQKTVVAARPGCQVDFNNQGTYGLAERVATMNNIDIEALPTAFWGYYYFPTLARYVRNFSSTCYGLTGRFKASWADFGGLKLPAQLDTELASIVANAAHCGIGDQMPPNGRLDPAVYHVIGKAYGRIRTLEPYLERAVPVTEAALLTGGLPLESPGMEANYGLVKLLIESRIQFDILEPEAAWERYGLIVLSDDQPVTPKLAERLGAFLAGGGAVVANHQSGLLAGTDWLERKAASSLFGAEKERYLENTGKSWMEPYGIDYAGPSPYKPAYLVPREAMTGDIPTYEYALYAGASQWRVRPPATAVATLGEPAFQRSPEHYTSHAQSPFDHLTGYAAVARSGRLALFGFPLGTSYFNEGYWIYRHALQHVLRQILPVQIVTSNAPLSSEITVTHQAAAAGRKERYLVHVVNFSALRHAKHPDFCEDPIALTDVEVRLHLPLKTTSAHAVTAGLDLPVRRTDRALEVTVPRIPVHEIISFEV